MNVCESISAIREQVNAWRSSGEKIAFVPTMGNLHAGHLSLVEKAKTLADRVVVSIFVNPMQFNEQQDFDLYPRTFDDDLEKLKSANVDAVFAPATNDIYPEGQQATTRVIVPELSEILEGECRPGHFTGVTTVVNKLFNMVQADIAVFGEKDFQQLMLIRRMVAELDMPIEIIAVPTSREEDGLAMSSRNNRLSSEQRSIAKSIYQALVQVVEAIRSGNKDYAKLCADASKSLDQQGFDTEYLVVRRQQDLAEPDQQDSNLVVLCAARLGDIRLIDNIST